ncbi:MAG: hypothetical protein P1R58_10990 [bacterium]|nr:hypothetical protein [bacterium]
MENRTGKIIAQLAEPDDSGAMPELIKMINRNVAPPSELKAEDVLVRAMYVASDRVNSFGGKFPIDELEQLAVKLIDSPVMVGHRKDSLPIGRNFHAVLTQKDSVPWVKAYFYWLKDSENSEQLRQNIDGGVYKECSIGFTFHLAECSICGQDIRSCRHEPLVRYRSDSDNSAVCCFLYRKIDKVLETSLVYRGAVPDTSLTNELSSARPAAVGSISCNYSASNDADPLVRPGELNPEEPLILLPFYEGRFAEVAVQSSQLQLRSGGVAIRLPRELATVSTQVPDFRWTPSLLVGYRGKERTSLAQLDRFLAGESSGVSHLEIMTIPFDKSTGVSQPVRSGQLCFRTIRCVSGTSETLGEKAESIASRDGVLIVGLSDQKVWRWKPEFQARRKAVGKYLLKRERASGRCLLQIRSAGKSLSYILFSFSSERCQTGVAFVAEPAAAAEIQSDGWMEASGDAIRSFRSVGDSLVIDCEGALEGDLVFRPLLIGGRKKFLVRLARNQSREAREIYEQA